jgi:hypothetical protein
LPPAVASAQATVTSDLLTQPLVLAAAPAPSAESWDDFREGWHYRSTLGLWASKIEGTVGRETGVGDFTSDVDSSFSDLVDKMTGAIGVNFELGNGPFTMLVNGQWNRFEDDAETRNGFDADVEAQLAWIDIAGSYKFFDETYGEQALENRLTLEGIVGVRWVYLSAEIDVNEGPFAGANEDREKNWFDPYVAARMKYSIDRNWNFTVSGGVGGFGLGSDLAWQAAGYVEYRFTQQFSLYGGYRAVAFDYDDDGFVFDTVLHGPEIGMGFRW